MTKKTIFSTILALALCAGASAFADQATFTPTPVFINGARATSHVIKVVLEDSKAAADQDGWAHLDLGAFSDLKTAAQVDLRLVNDKKMTVTMDGHGGSILHFKGGSRQWKDVGTSRLNYQGGPATLYITWWN